MTSASTSSTLLLCFMIMVSSSMVKIQRVGGPAGWTLHGKDTKYPTRSTKIYHAGHDTLMFLYNKNTNNVLQVSYADYMLCRMKQPIARYNSGSDAIKMGISITFAACPSIAGRARRFMPRSRPVANDLGRDYENNAVAALRGDDGA